jgi:hypothetical protein
VKNRIFLAKSNESHLKKIGKERADGSDEANKDVNKYQEEFEKTYENVLTGKKSALSHSGFCRYITVCLFQSYGAFSWIQPIQPAFLLRGRLILSWMLWRKMLISRTIFTIPCRV